MKKVFLFLFRLYWLSAFLIGLIVPLRLCANHSTSFPSVSNQTLAPLFLSKTTLKKKGGWRRSFDSFPFQTVKRLSFPFEKGTEQKKPVGTFSQIEPVSREKNLRPLPFLFATGRQKKRPSNVPFQHQPMHSFCIPIDGHKNPCSSFHPTPQQLDCFVFDLPLSLKKVKETQTLFFPCLNRSIHVHFHLRGSGLIEHFPSLKQKSPPLRRLKKEGPPFLAPLFFIQKDTRFPIFLNKSPCFAVLPIFRLSSLHQDSLNQIPLNLQRLSFFVEAKAKKGSIKKKSLFFQRRLPFEKGFINKKYTHSNSCFHVQPLVVSRPFSSNRLPPSVNTDEIDLPLKEPFKRESKDKRVFLKRPLLATCPLNSIEFPFAVPILNRANRSTKTFLTQTFAPFFIQTINYDNALHPTIYYAKQDDAPGYAFCIKIDPHKTIPSFSRPQSFTFILDRSSQSHTHRFTTFKEGTQKALAYLKEGDCFNILILDQKVTPLSATPLPCNPVSIAKAKAFLMKESQKKGLVSPPSFDLFSSVLKGLAPGPQHHVILMTDGRFFQPIHQHARQLNELIETNRGHFSLFTAAASQGNELATLDLLSGFNKGSFMHSKTNVSFSRHLISLIKQIQGLIGKEIALSAIQKEKEVRIHFYRNQKYLPSLYARSPYFIYGTIDELKEFNLIFQIYTNDQSWIHIKESISFKEAQKAPPLIQKQMAYQKVHVHYNTFLNTHHPLALKEAQRILENTLYTPPYRNR